MYCNEKQVKYAWKAIYNFRKDGIITKCVDELWRVTDKFCLICIIIRKYCCMMKEILESVARLLYSIFNEFEFFTNMPCSCSTYTGADCRLLHGLWSGINLGLRTSV